MTKRSWVTILIIAMVLATLFTIGCDTSTPAAFQLTNLAVSPQETMVGEPVEISVTVSNTGDSDGVCAVSLMLNGAMESSQDITVAGKSGEEMSFMVTKDVAGIYDVTVDGLAATLVVMTDHLVITMSFDDDPDGYPQGSEVNVSFLTGHRFQLSDRYGTFSGDYSWNAATDKLTLDFASYPSWYITLYADGRHFHWH